MRVRYWKIGAVAVAALAVAACGRKKEIFNKEMDMIRAWVESRNNDDEANYTEVSSGVFRGIFPPEDGSGTVPAERGDSLYLMYELCRFTSSFTERGKADIVYTNKPDLMPERVEWNRDTLRMVLGDGKLLKGVEEALRESAEGDLVVVVMTSGNAFGQHSVQQLPPNTPVAWRIDVEKVIDND